MAEGQLTNFIVQMPDPELSWQMLRMQFLRAFEGKISSAQQAQVNTCGRRFREEVAANHQLIGGQGSHDHDQTGLPGVHPEIEGTLTEGGFARHPMAVLEPAVFQQEGGNVHRTPAR